MIRLLTACLLGAGLVAASAQPLPLIPAQGLTIEGAFRIPVGGPGTGDERTANYGGNCLKHVAGTGGGSLLVCGLSTKHRIAQIGIPTPSLNPALAQLPVAALIQPFGDVLQGKAHLIYGTDPNASVQIGGVLPRSSSEWIVSVYGIFDTNAPLHPKTHFIAGSNLSAPQYISGPFQVGDPAMPGFVGGPMGEMSTAYRTRLGRFYTSLQASNINGRTSSGPDLNSFDPAQVGVIIPAPATRLLAYPILHPTIGAWGGQCPTPPCSYNGASYVNGWAFPENTRTGLAFGTRGVGPFCYGQGTADPSKIGQFYEPGVPYCFDPENPGVKSNHAYPYEFTVWAYDLDELEKVKLGQKLMWDVRPYAVWPFTLPHRAPSQPGAEPTHNLQAVDYDPATGRIFLAQQHAGPFGETIINVLRVGGTPQPSPTPTPTPTPSPTPTPTPTPPPSACTRGVSVLFGGFTWTLGPGGAALKDGQPATGSGSEYLVTGGQLYIHGGDFAWYRRVEPSWAYVGAEPLCTTPTPTPTPTPLPLLPAPITAMTTLTCRLTVEVSAPPDPTGGWARQIKRDTGAGTSTTVGANTSAPYAQVIVTLTMPTTWTIFEVWTKAGASTRMSAIKVVECK